MSKNAGSDNTAVNLNIVGATLVNYSRSTSRAFVQRRIDLNVANNLKDRIEAFVGSSDEAEKWSLFLVSTRIFVSIPESLKRRSIAQRILHSMARDIS